MEGIPLRTRYRARTLSSSSRRYAPAGQGTEKDERSTSMTAGISRSCMGSRRYCTGVTLRSRSVAGLKRNGTSMVPGPAVASASQSAKCDKVGEKFSLRVGQRRWQLGAFPLPHASNPGDRNETLHARLLLVYFHILNILIPADKRSRGAATVVPFVISSRRRIPRHTWPSVRCSRRQ